MRVVICISLIFFGLITLRANALSDGEEYYATINANKLIDLVIQAAKSRVRSSLEPVLLPDTNKTITVPFGPIDLTAIIKAVNGTLSGLSSIVRLSNASFEFDDHNSSMSLDLIAQNLEIVYQTEIIVLGLISTTAQVIGKIPSITINTTLLMDSKGALALKQFFIEELDDIAVEVHGNGISDVVLKLLIEVFTSLARNNVKDELSSLMLTVIGPLFQQSQER